MPAPLSSEAKALIDRPNFAHLATLMPDGSPQSVPVWVGREGDRLLVCTSEGSLKGRNTRRDPRVALSIVDFRDPYEEVQLRGRVVERRPDPDLRDQLDARRLVITIAGGVPTADVESCLATGVPVVRVMPNIAAQVGGGAAAIAGGTAAGEEHLALVEQVFSAVGRCVRVPEAMMDAVTGLSGSGPGYVCLLIEGLADGGVKMGLPRDVALTLAAQTLRGQPGVVYAGDECHLTLLEISGRGRDATLELSLVREDGAVPYSRTFAARI